MSDGLYDKWVEMNCPDCDLKLYDDGSCNCLAYGLRVEIKKLETENEELKNETEELEQYKKYIMTLEPELRSAPMMTYLFSPNEWLGFYADDFYKFREKKKA